MVASVSVLVVMSSCVSIATYTVRVVYTVKRLICEAPTCTCFTQTLKEKLSVHALDQNHYKLSEILSNENKCI